VIPANAKLPEHNPNIKAWDKLTPDQQKLYARFMEVYAGYLIYTDFEVGRLVNHLKELGQLDNTLIFISIGDKGAGKEGSLEGGIDRSILRTKQVPEEENVAYNLAKITRSARLTQSRATIRWGGRRPLVNVSAEFNSWRLPELLSLCTPNVHDPPRWWK
jgi:arylsulfatase A-like enzyme